MMPRREFPRLSETPAAELTDRIVDSLQSQQIGPVDEDIVGDEAREGSAGLGRIDTYLYWNAFDRDRPR